MIDQAIEYKSIIMRCDQINKRAYLELDKNVQVEFYQKGMESVWAHIQKSAGEFSHSTDSEVVAYFMNHYGKSQEELEKRCMFLKESNTGKYIGTCMAWFGKRLEENISVLHWLAVCDEFSQRGYARMLITEVLKKFEQLGESQKIYLHTQPCSYRAIKLYNDFGFCMTKTDTYGTAINEFDQAIPILKQHMTLEAYLKLVNTSI